MFKCCGLILFICMLSVQCGVPTPTNPVSEKPDDHTSQSALDVNGTYTGVVPCADCEGIKTTLVLSQPTNFELHTQYLGKSDSTVHIEKGNYNWLADGLTIRLILPQDTLFYKVGENQVQQLDRAGNSIESNLRNQYILRK